MSIRKLGLYCTQNTPIHIAICNSFAVKLHDILYEKLHEWCKFYKILVVAYKVTYVSLKSKNIVKFYVHISPIFGSHTVIIPIVNFSTLFFMMLLNCIDIWHYDYMHRYV